MDGGDSPSHPLPNIRHFCSDNAPDGLSARRDVFLLVENTKDMYGACVVRNRNRDEWSMLYMYIDVQENQVIMCVERS